jgi:hypothetical protein
MVSPLAMWQNFYVIIGSAAAALTGLMFVVVTLTARSPLRALGEGLAAFGTPTVVHLCAALGVAALLAAPWPAAWQACPLLGFCGLGGIVYIIIVLWRARRQATYQPVLEDWLWHTIFPLVSYTTFLVAAIALPGNPIPDLFIIAAATLLLLFIGIHNAWDTVTYIVIEESRRQDRSQE